MQTRRDQLQAYRFLIKRILASLLGNQPESPEQPMRRVMLSTFSGIMAGVLACAGVGLYGWLTGSSARAWKEGGALIVEKETGTRYIYRTDAGILNPIVNYTSARLLLSGDIKIQRVSRKSLASTPRGPALGILGAPDSLPDQKNIVSKPWTICSEEEPADQGTTPEVDLLVGRTDIGAANVGNRALVVASGDGQLWYIGNGTRHETDQTSMRSLNLGDSPQTTVGAAWLNAVPQGADLKPPVIPNRGKPGLGVNSAPTTVGQIFRTEALNGDPAYYVMRLDGVAQLTQTQAQLILGSSAANQQPSNSDDATDVPLNAINEASQSPSKIDAEGLPRTIPARVDLASGAGATVCAWFDEPGKPLRITVNGEVPDPAEGSESNAGVGTGLTADHVNVVSGQAAVVAARTTAGSPPSAYYLVTDAGVKFPVPDEGTLGKLGYGGVKPLEVPPGILGLVPQGPALNAEDAARPAPVVPPAAAPAK
jgi:type VII secretion protein EccB